MEFKNQSLKLFLSGRTDAGTDEPKQYAPSTFFKVGGLKKQ